MYDFADVKFDFLYKFVLSPIQDGIDAFAQFLK